MHAQDKSQAALDCVNSKTLQSNEIHHHKHESNTHNSSLDSRIGQQAANMLCVSLVGAMTHDGKGSSKADSGYIMIFRKNYGPKLIERCMKFENLPARSRDMSVLVSMRCF